MDKISIRGLEVFANHGVFKEENVLGQKFIGNAELVCDTRSAGQEDNLEKSVNYAEVCNLITKVMRNNTFKLIEAAAENIAEKILLEYDLIREVTITLKKPWAPIMMSVDTVEVSITRKWHRAYIALGSNMGDSKGHLDGAVKELDAALMLQELVHMGVSNIITFDAHDPRISNAIPLAGFDDVQATYQMIKALVRAVPDISLNKKDTIVISPDEGGMSRCMYYSSVLKLDLGMFYKRRDYSVIVNGKNPIEAHEYLGRDVNGKDVIIVDDMISSGESVIDVANNLKKQGAKRIFVFASFGLFCNGLECFDKAAADGIVDKIFTTNLIYRNPDLATREWYCEVDMSKYISLLIDTLNHDETISSLLNPVTKIKNLVSKLENK